MDWCGEVRGVRGCVGCLPRHRSPHYRCIGSFASVSAGSSGAPLALRELVAQDAHVVLAPVEQPLERARRVARERVRGEQRQRDGGVEVAHHRVRQPVGIDLAPAHRLGRRRAGEAAGVGTRVGDLQEVVVALLVDAEHFLDLRLGLQHEVLRAAAAADQHRALPAAALRAEHDRRRLVHVGVRVDHALVPLERQRRDVHADRRVARRRRVDRHAALVRRRRAATCCRCRAPSRARGRTCRTGSGTPRSTSGAGTPGPG